MPLKLPTISQAVALLLSGAAYAGLAYATPRANFGQVLGLFGVALLAYAWLLRSRLPRQRQRPGHLKVAKARL